MIHFSFLLSLLRDLSGHHLLPSRLCLFSSFLSGGSLLHLERTVGLFAFYGIHALYTMYASLAHGSAMAYVLTSEGMTTPENHAKAQKEHGNGKNYEAGKCEFQHYFVYLQPQR